jgi:hypothetical protein
LPVSGTDLGTWGTSRPVVAKVSVWNCKPSLDYAQISRSAVGPARYWHCLTCGDRRFWPGPLCDLHMLGSLGWGWMGGKDCSKWVGTSSHWGSRRSSMRPCGGTKLTARTLPQPCCRWALRCRVAGLVQGSRVASARCQAVRRKICTRGDTFGFLEARAAMEYLGAEMDGSGAAKLRLITPQLPPVLGPGAVANMCLSDFLAPRLPFVVLSWTIQCQKSQSPPRRRPAGSSF